jgi:AraC family transcriptional regulator
VTSSRDAFQRRRRAAEGGDLRNNFQDQPALGFETDGVYSEVVSAPSDVAPEAQKQLQRGALKDHPVDPIIDALRAVMQIAFDQSAVPCPLFTRAIACAIQAHLAHAFAAADRASSPPRRRLTPSQETRAKQFLVGNAENGVSIARAALACTLSRGYFIRAFKDTTGETPHQWLSMRRVEKAKVLLSGQRSIAEIALDCGFADQSHFTRVFARMVGAPPGAWRNEFRSRTLVVPDDSEEVAPSEPRELRETRLG